MGIDIAAERKRKEKQQEKDSQIFRPGQVFNDAGEIVDVGYVDSTVKKISIDCGACKSVGSMTPSSVPRFGGFIRIIGWIIAAPSVVGVFLSAAMFFGFTKATSDTMGKAAEPMMLQEQRSEGRWE